jgi:hypothetical protein
MNPTSSYPARADSEDFTPDRLIVGGPITSRKVTISSGQNKLVRGTVLAKLDSGGEYVKSVTGGSDGSQTPDAILSEDVDATVADVEAMVYRTGQFDETALTLGASHTVASIREGLRVKGILLITPAVLA